MCALRFFYGVTLNRGEIPERIAYARTPRKLPAILSPDEVVRFLKAVPSLKSRAALTTAYAAGLRVSEAVSLKVGDIDSDRMLLQVRHGKRHIAVDTDGRLLMVNLTTADISDSAGAQAIVAAIRKRWPWLKHLFADGAYDRTRLMDAATYPDFIFEIIRRSDKEPGFKVLPRRWVVERTFGWMTRWKRLVRDYEQRIDVSEAMIHVALGSLMLRRIVHP